MSATLETSVLRKVSIRLLPFLCLLYIVNILDRQNIGFAKLQMMSALGLVEGDYSLAAGAFFIGYALLGVPSNLVLARIGASRWIGLLMISWGVISASTMGVGGPTGFTLLRLLLGCAEAGFFPGILLYLTYWFPARERARAVALFMTASPLAGLVGSPVSGALLQYADGWAGVAGWQWLFVLEALPAILLGVVVFCILPDRPKAAHWLGPEEQAWLTERLDREAGSKDDATTVWQVLVDGRAWFLATPYVALAGGISALSFYLPTFVQQRFPNSDPLTIGLLAAVPSACTIVGMAVIAAHSDRTGERRWHVAGPAFLAAVGWGTYACFENPLASLLALTLAQVGMMSALPPFWSLAKSSLSIRAAPAGLALINAVGNLGGFVGPNVLGQYQPAVPDFVPRLALMGLLLIVGGGLVLLVRRPAKNAS